jgi:RNA polymerase sigma-70 factor (ECF subfamily)
VDAPDEDALLMLALRAGDSTAFDALFRRWAAPLLRYLERMLRDAGAAEELVQEVFLRVHGARERYQPQARFSTWLYRIATNLALNELRRPRRREAHASVDEPDGPALAADGPAPEAALDARRLAARVEQELARLPERQRAALCLSAVEGLSYADVAAALEISESAVKALVHRARTALVAQLPDAV